MVTRPVTSDQLQQLHDERDAADRAYNDALTAVDRAMVGPSAPAPPPLPYDEHVLPAVNESWEILQGVSLPAPRGVRSRIAHFVWRLVAPVFERQQAFNARLVDHLNRNAPTERETIASLARLADTVAAHTSALAALQSRLLAYFQQITLYVDTKDRLTAGSWMPVYYEAVNALTDELLRSREAMNAREARVNGRVAAITVAHDELRGTLATLQQATQTMRRELERALSAPAAPAAPAAPVTSIDSYKYLGFEDRFRGVRDEIAERLRSYVPLFAGRRDVLDVGCGRGEFLDLLAEQGVGARGLEMNHEMVESCRARGLDVAEGDMVGYLESLPDGALGGLVAVQVVEHLEPAYLMRALDVAYHKLRPGSPIVLETINPACWFAFFSSYIRDLTHVRPIHPDTLQYLLTASGFGRARIEYHAPYPDAEKLQQVVTTAPGDPRLVTDFSETFNANVERLNDLMFTYLDYAAIGERL